MPTGFDTAFRKVRELVADFRANEKFCQSPAYQEQEARRDFIDKFWIALGWDVNHETQKNPCEQEVKVERAFFSLSASNGERGGVRCRTSRRRADYVCWRRGSNRGAAQSDRMAFQPLTFSLQPCPFNALDDVLYALTPDEIKIVEGK